MDERTARRFWSKVDKRDDGCWEWTAYRMKNGYGTLRVATKGWLAHRFAYQEFVGPIPDGLEIDHLCRNRACVNPDHLEAVDHRTNLMRGNTWAAANAKKTHCVNGHEFDEENTLIVPLGRNCRACHREREAARYRSSRLPES